MKINSKWIGLNILLFLLIIFMSWIIIELLIVLKKQPEQTAALITFIILVLLINTSCIVLIFMNTLYGNMYYKISFIPIEKFKINKYANMHVWSLNSWAYIYTYGREKLLTLKEIKSIQYYNRKIKPTEFYLLPYESFKKEI